MCPGRDHAVRVGERVTAVGTPAQFARHGAGAVVEPLRQQEPVRAGARTAGAARAAERDDQGRAGLWSLLRSLAAEADRPLRVVIGILGVVLVISVLVLQAGYVKPDGSHMTLVDAAYFTVETLATVGYGDFNFAGQETWLRVYAIGLMGGGAVLTAIVFALVTQLLVSRRIEGAFGQRRVGAMRGHVVVVGLGTVAMEVVEELVAAGRRVVAIDRDEAGRHHARARALGVPIVIGDATDTEVLDAANLVGAAAVAVLTSDDFVNVETGLVVRERLGERWASVPVVLRVFDRELAGGVEDGFGFRNVRSTASLAAPWFVGAALGLEVLGTFYVDHTPFLVGQLSVTAGGGLDGLAMGELSERARVVALRRADGGAGAPAAARHHLRRGRRGLPRRAARRGDAGPAPRRPGSARGRGGDAVAADLAVDRGAGHAEVARRLGLVAVVVQQRVDDRVALDRLQRREHAAGDGADLGRQVVRGEDARPAARDGLAQHLVELVDVARPPVAHEQPHRLR